MRTNLEQLYREVHFLAYYYHWTEAEILSMSREKRRMYIGMLSEQLGVEGEGEYVS